VKALVVAVQNVLDKTIFFSCSSSISKHNLQGGGQEIAGSLKTSLSFTDLNIVNAISISQCIQKSQVVVLHYSSAMVSTGLSSPLC